MNLEKLITIIVGGSVILLLLILIRIIVCPERIFQTKKSYEKECVEYEERCKNMNRDYPDLISRLSFFFDLPKDEVIKELRNICKEDSNDNSGEV